MKYRNVNFMEVLILLNSCNLYAIMNWNVGGLT